MAARVEGVAVKTTSKDRSRWRDACEQAQRARGPRAEVEILKRLNSRPTMVRPKKGAVVCVDDYDNSSPAGVAVLGDVDGVILRLEVQDLLDWLDN